LIVVDSGVWNDYLNGRNAPHVRRPRGHRPQNDRPSDRTWCIENGIPLLHNDSDFHPMARYLGLIELT
jgi:hypothetical protein